MEGIGANISFHCVGRILAISREPRAFNADTDAPLRYLLHLLWIQLSGMCKLARFAEFLWPHRHRRFSTNGAERLCAVARPDFSVCQQPGKRRCSANSSSFVHATRVLGRAGHDDGAALSPGLYHSQRSLIQRTFSELKPGGPAFTDDAVTLTKPDLSQAQCVARSSRSPRPLSAR